MTISISPTWWDHLQVAPLTPWWPKLELKILPHLAQSRDSELMDRFWYSRCLNNRTKVPDMTRLFAGGTTTPLVVKILTKQPWVKIENLHNFDCNFALFRGKIWLWLFYNYFCFMVQRFYTKKWLWPKMKAWRRFSRILISIWIGKINVTPSFLLEMTWNFLCRILKL